MTRSHQKGRKRRTKGMTAKERVLKVWPELKSWPYGDRIFIVASYPWRWSYGHGPTPRQAWADAARRLKP